MPEQGKDTVANQVTGTQSRAGDLFPLIMRGVSFVRNQQHLLDGVDLQLAGDGLTLVMGPNGAGKSLLIRLMHGLLLPSDGHIAWGGSAVGGNSRARQAMVFQRPVLLRRSVAANVDFALRLQANGTGVDRSRLLDAVQLADLVDRPARLLSGGEQQRLALARALATRPDVLFLDEPTASLDPASTKIIEDIILAERNAGTKIIFVTHDVAQARRLGDDIVFLYHGKVVEHRPAGRFFDEPASAAARDYLAGRIVI